MKVKGSIISALFLLISGWAQAQDTFVIEGQVKNVKEGVRLELFRMENGVGDIIAVDTLRGDTFRFEQQTLGGETDKLAFMIIDDDWHTLILDLWVRPGAHIKLTGENMWVYTWQVESNVPQQHIWQLFVDDSRDLWNEYQLNDRQEKLLFSEFQKQGTTDERKAELRTQGINLEKINEKIQIQISANTINRMKQLPIDEVWMEQLKSLAVGVKYTKDFPYRKEVEDLYGRLSEEQRQTPEAWDIQTYLSSPDTVSLQTKAADGDLFDLQGQVHHLSDFKGKPVLIDFWSRGCGPCLMALPEMEEISKKYEGCLVLVSLSIDDKTGWEIASRHHKITWWNLNDLKGQHGIYAKYTSGAIPRYVFLSPEGEVVEMWSGYGKGSLLKKLEKLMK